MRLKKMSKKLLLDTGDADSANLDEFIQTLKPICPDIDLRLMLDSDEALILQEMLNISRQMKLEIAETKIMEMIKTKGVETFGTLRKTLLHTAENEIMILNSAPDIGVDMKDIVNQILDWEVKDND